MSPALPAVPGVLGNTPRNVCVTGDGTVRPSEFDAWKRMSSMLPVVSEDVAVPSTSDPTILKLIGLSAGTVVRVIFPVLPMVVTD